MSLPEECPSCGQAFGHGPECDLADALPVSAVEAMIEAEIKAKAAALKMLASYEEAEAISRRIRRAIRGMDVREFRALLDAAFGEHPKRIFHEGA